MSKKTCFMIFVISIITILAAYIFNITTITVPVNNIFSSMQNPYIAGISILISLLLNKQKYYWLIMIGCAVIIAIIIQLFILNSSFVILAIIYKASAILVYAYLTSLIRFML